MTVQKYALKVVRDDPDVKTEIVAIQAICRSDPPNPHVIRVHDFWFQDNDIECTSRTFIQMEICDGTLEEYLKERESRCEPLEPLEISEIMIQILTGLQHCHVQGFCHRDLKLPNSISFKFISRPLIPKSCLSRDHVPVTANPKSTVRGGC
jgi:serine/threonine protein kinase